jgi:hypothetical protein
MDDLESRVDYAADLVYVLVSEAKISQSSQNPNYHISSLEKSLIAHYDICKFNGESTSEFRKEICDYGKMKLSKLDVPSGCFGFSLGASTAVLGAFIHSYQLLAVGGLVAFVSIPVSVYSVRKKMKSRAQAISAIIDMEFNKYILDGALKKLRDEK